MWPQCPREKSGPSCSWGCRRVGGCPPTTRRCILTALSGPAGLGVHRPKEANAMTSPRPSEPLRAPFASPDLGAVPGGVFASTPATPSSHDPLLRTRADHGRPGRRYEAVPPCHTARGGPAPPLRRPPPAPPPRNARRQCDAVVTSPTEPPGATTPQNPQDVSRPPGGLRGPRRGPDGPRPGPGPPGADRYRPPRPAVRRLTGRAAADSCARASTWGVARCHGSGGYSALVPNAGEVLHVC